MYLLTFTCILPKWAHRCALQSSQNQLYTKQKKKVKMGLAAEGEVRQTTAKSKCSQFKKEMGNITCLDRAFVCAVQPLSIGSFSSIFMANSSVLKLHKYLLNP